MKKNTSPKPRTATAPTPDSPDFKEMVNLLAVFSEATSRLAEIEAAANSELLQLIDEHKAEYAKLQETCNAAQAALETICRSHPEWFGEQRNIKTPYGKVSFRSSPSLQVENDEATVKLLRAEQDRSQAQHNVDGTSPVFKADDFIRTVHLPNLEALEGLDDTMLARFMVKRVVKDSFSVGAAKVDFGKAVKDSTEATKN